MHLFSCNNYVEYFIFINCVLNKFDNSIRKDFLFLIPRNIYNNLGDKERNNYNFYITNKSNLYLSKNPLRFFILCLRFYICLQEIKRKYKINKIYSFGYKTGNSLFLNKVFNKSEIEFLTLHNELKRNNNKIHKKLDLFYTLSLSINYIIFLQKFGFVYKAKSEKKSYSWSDVKFFPYNLKPTLLNLDANKNSNEKIDRIIVVGERLDPKKSYFTIEEESNYLNFISLLKSESDKNDIQIYFFIRDGFTEKYHDFLKQIGIKLINNNGAAFEQYLKDLKCNPLIVGIKSTCLVTAKMLGYNSLAIGKLIKLNDSNKTIINSFLNSFGSLSPIKVNTKDDIFKYIHKA